MGTDIHPYAEVRENGAWRKANVKMPSDRDYWSFAVLADVRNGCGFAGIDIGDPVTPISKPRGLPDDLSFESTKLDDEAPGFDWSVLDTDGCLDFGDHSFSWVTLHELLDLDMSQKITHRGMAPTHIADQVEATGKMPKYGTWAGWSSIDDWRKIEFSEPMSETLTLIPKLIAALQPLGDPDNVRLVFGFDS